MAATQISGGAGLEQALAGIFRRLGAPMRLEVGFMEGATEPDGTSIPLIAALNNFGTGRIPARPFFSNMVKEKSGEWPAVLARLLQESDWDGPRSLAILGKGITGQLKQAIIDMRDPPNAPSTIAKKGFDDPLVDTGNMLNAATYRVAVGR